MSSYKNQNLFIELISGLAVGGFIGYFIDAKFETSPSFLIICAIFGMMGGFYNCYKDAVKDMEKEKDLEK